MMKKISIFFATAMLFACAQFAPPSAEPISEVGMPNAASTFCVQEGGQSVSGVCVLANGTEMDEWDYFHTHAPK